MLGLYITILIVSIYSELGLKQMQNVAMKGTLCITIAG